MDYSTSERGAALPEYVLLLAIGGLIAFALMTALRMGLASKIQEMINAFMEVGS